MPQSCIEQSSKRKARLPPDENDDDITALFKSEELTLTKLKQNKTLQHVT